MAPLSDDHLRYPLRRRGERRGPARLQVVDEGVGAWGLEPPAQMVVGQDLRVRIGALGSVLERKAGVVLGEPVCAGFAGGDPSKL